MTEPEFWNHLARRLCLEFAGLPDRAHRYLWCDGLIPESHTLSGPTPTISGRAWIGNGSRRQSQWTFVLKLPASTHASELIDWPSLLPADNLTHWMSFDENAHHLELEPSAATPDLAIPCTPTALRRGPSPRSGEVP